MAVQIEQYHPPNWEWIIYYRQSGTAPSGDSIMAFDSWGFLVLDLPGLEATARLTAASRPPTVGSFILVFPSRWFQILTVQPADHGYYRLTLAPYVDQA